MENDSNLKILYEGEIMLDILSFSSWTQLQENSCIIKPCDMVIISLYFNLILHH